MAQLVFARKEMKYLVPEEKYLPFLADLVKHTAPDPYRTYTVCNVYYDTDIFNLIRMSMDRPLYKEKLRMRSYGVPSPDTPVYIEIKKKYDRRVYKRRETLPYAAACDFFDRGIYPAEQDTQIMRELRYALERYKPTPRLFIAYEREAYMGIGEERGLRVTFDNGIRYRTQDVSLAAGDHGKPLFDNNDSLLEIKFSGAMPLWLAELLGKHGIRRRSFSKYGRIYEKEFENLHKEP